MASRRTVPVSEHDLAVTSRVTDPAVLNAAGRMTRQHKSRLAADATELRPGSEGGEVEISETPSDMRAEFDKCYVDLDSSLESYEDTRERGVLRSEKRVQWGARRQKAKDGCCSDSVREKEGEGKQRPVAPRLGVLPSPTCNRTIDEKPAVMIAVAAAPPLVQRFASRYGVLQGRSNKLADLFSCQSATHIISDLPRVARFSQLTLALPTPVHLRTGRVS